MDVRVKDGSTAIAEAWGGFVVTGPIPAPTIDLPADPPLIGVDVPIGISSRPASPRLPDRCHAGLAGLHGLDGTLDAIHAVREATATCQFAVAGTYQVDASMTDVLGTTTHTSRTLTVVAEDTTAPR